MRINRLMRLIAAVLVVTVCFQQSSHGLALDNITERNEERYRNIVDAPEWDCLAEDSLELADMDGAIISTASLSSNISGAREEVVVTRHASNIAQSAAILNSESTKSGSVIVKNSVSAASNKKINTVVAKTTPVSQTATNSISSTTQKNTTPSVSPSSSGVSFSASSSRRRNYGPGYSWDKWIFEAVCPNMYKGENPPNTNSDRTKKYSEYRIRETTPGEFLLERVGFWYFGRYSETASPDGHDHTGGQNPSDYPEDGDDANEPPPEHQEPGDTVDGDTTPDDYMPALG